MTTFTHLADRAAPPGAPHAGSSAPVTAAATGATNAANSTPDAGLTDARLADALLAAPPAELLAEPVAPRAEARVDATRVRLHETAAVKQNTFTSRPGYARAAAHWQTHLHAEAWVRNTSYEKRVWADVHVHAHDGALVRRLTLPFAYVRPMGDGGDLFQLDHVLFDGATATPGSVSLGPDVRLVQFRLYAECGGEVVTDGAVHEGVLRADVVTP